MPAANLATPEIDSRLTSLRSNLDALLQRFTDAHPDVVNTRRMIRELEDQRKKEVAELQKQAESNPQVMVDSDPVLSDMSRVLSQSDVQVASLRARVAEYESRARRAQEQMKLAPQMEAELAQLNRDYEINRKNYEDLVARRESIAMSGQLESASSLADFRVIDPPRANPRPVAPNRALLMPLALLAALGAGLGVAFLMSQVRPVFFEASTLRTATALRWGMAATTAVMRRSCPSRAAGRPCAANKLARKPHRAKAATNPQARAATHHTSCHLGAAPPAPTATPAHRQH